MGLDSVELVLTVEDVFDITIPDEHAPNMATVGDLHQFVVGELIRLGRPNVDRDVVYDLLRNLICFQLGVKPEQVTPAARFVQDLHAD